MVFTISPELLVLQQLTRDFIRDELIPLERGAARPARPPQEAPRREFVGASRWQPAC